MLKRAAVPGVLFLSDVPSECQETDLSDLFRDYGPLTGIQLIRDGVLSYARVYFEAVEDALAAVGDLEEELFMGQPLRISWSTPFDVVSLFKPVSLSSISFMSTEDLKPPPIHVLFSYISSQVVERISEHIIAESFTPFGILTDVSIKKHNTVPDGGYQNGFGFVQFVQSWQGIQCAIRAVKWFDKKYMGHMTIDAKFGQQFQKFLVKNLILTEEEIAKMKTANPTNGGGHLHGSNTRRQNDRAAPRGDVENTAYRGGYDRNSQTAHAPAASYMYERNEIAQQGYPAGRFPAGGRADYPDSGAPRSGSGGYYVQAPGGASPSSDPMYDHQYAPHQMSLPPSYGKEGPQSRGRPQQSRSAGGYPSGALGPEGQQTYFAPDNYARRPPPPQSAINRGLDAYHEMLHSNRFV